jgi:hypothetical protein
MKRKSSPHRARRAVLSLLALAAFAGPPAASGCSAGFEPISQVDTLRVFGVVADKPYAQPGEQVTFTISYADGASPSGAPQTRPIEILWLGGCTDPAGDEYYGCYSLFTGDGGTGPEGLPSDIIVGSGESFTMTVPPGIITDPPVPSKVPRTYGLAIVFFGVCAGTIRSIPPDGTGLAGSLPFGCFDAGGTQLGADSFVPGYTQVYAFADGRQNANPTIDGLTLNGGALPGRQQPGVTLSPPPPVVTRCPVTEADRGSAGCGKTDPSKACADLELSVFFRHPEGVSEIDPSGTTEDGSPLHEEVWVDYFADGGDIDSPVLLVYDATTGLQPSYSTRWYPPPTPGPVRLWAVVHDSRGGESVMERTVNVE